MPKFKALSPSPEKYYLFLLKVLYSDVGAVLVAEEGGVVIGFIMSYVDQDRYSDTKTGFCEDIYIEKDYRHRGIDKLLIEKSIEIGEQIGIKAIEFITSYDEGLIKVWNRRGYEPYKVMLRKKL